MSNVAIFGILLSGFGSALIGFNSGPSFKHGAVAIIGGLIAYSGGYLVGIS